MLKRNRALLVLLTGLIAVSPQCALGRGNAGVSQSQSTDANLPAYEVTSIKPSKSDDDRMRIQFVPDGVFYTNVPLQMILRESFGVEDDRILGAPGWVKTDHFDIEAKVDAADVSKLNTLSFEQKKMMLVPVLVDRFGLKFHHEMKTLSTYALVVAKGGAKLKEATPGDTYPNGMKGPEGQPGVGFMSWGDGKIFGQGISIANLVKALAAQELDRTIVDKTGLTGKYDIDLRWAPNESSPVIAPGGQPNPPVNDASTDSGASLFTAIQEKLGLKLESQKGLVDVVVIDHIETSSEN
jgi:uncharacterized protein (TIGR03435 family)